MASLSVTPQRPTLAPPDRRLQEEFALLREMLGRNPDRLADLVGDPDGDDRIAWLTLRNTPARRIDSDADTGLAIHEHRLRLHFPRFFPALPLELYLQQPVFHPNIHPETGFACLWDRHQQASTAEDALHKIASMLGWRLFNLEPEHIMQPGAAALSLMDRERLARSLHAPPLAGVRGLTLPPEATQRRRRLS